MERLSYKLRCWKKAFRAFPSLRFRLHDGLLIVCTDFCPSTRSSLESSSPCFGSTIFVEKPENRPDTSTRIYMYFESGSKKWYVGSASGGKRCACNEAGDGRAPIRAVHPRPAILVAVQCEPRALRCTGKANYVAAPQAVQRAPDSVRLFETQGRMFCPLCSHPWGSALPESSSGEYFSFGS